MRRSRSKRMAAVAQSRYWRQEDAECALDALSDSGLSLTAFARKWGINEGRLRRWQARLGRAALVRAGGAEILPGFSPVEVVLEDATLSSSDSGVELVLRSGHRVALQRGFDRHVLEEVLRVVDAAC